MNGREDLPDSEPGLARILHKLRSDAGLTQEELAEKAGISARTISDVERGLRTSVYQDTAERLAAALGLDPGQAREFEAAARIGARRGPGDQAALTDRHLLPIPTNKLVGRERELEVILRALANPDIRLLTLTGPGGIGKTRLAIEAAHYAAREPLQVFFVPLSSVADAALVPSTIAVSIGVTSAEESVTYAIAKLIADSSVLLVLDTFEHLLDASPLVAEVLSRCPRLKILVTSRETLHMTMEHEVVVPSLEIPPERPSVEQVSELAATRLFLERLSLVKGDFVLDENSAGLVRDICLRLNGLPLALELAAARVKHLSLTGLSEQLEARLRVLTGGARDLPRRQQTMRDAVAWSYDLLTTEEQLFFRSLSVLAGGWTLEAASEISEADRDSLGRTSALVDKSLVVLSWDERSRYSMLDVIREFSIERAEEAGEIEGLRGRHAAFFVKVAEGAEPEFYGPAQKDWFRRLEIEHDNFRSALSWSIEQRNSDMALRLAGALWQIWRRQGHTSEGRMWLREALALEASDSHRLRAKALWGAGWLAFVEGDFEEGQRLSNELVELARREKLPLEERNGLTVRGMIVLSLGRFDAALESFRNGLELSRSLPDRWIVATSHLNLGTAKMHAGDLESAEMLVRQARQLYEEIGDKTFFYRCTGYLGFTSMLGGDISHAEAQFCENLKGSAAVEDLQGVAEAFEGLAAVSAKKRDRDSSLRSAELWGAATTVRDRLTAKQYPHDRAAMDRFLDIAKEILGSGPWQKAFEEGMRLELEEAIGLALKTP